MNKKNMKIISAFLIVGIILFSMIILNIEYIQTIIKNIKIEHYGQPINETTGLINNNYFDIEPQNSKKATNGINQAIEYAIRNNISYIKLEKAEYLIDAIGAMDEKKGIILKSNIELDLNGSTLVIEKNDSPYYSAITVQDENNIKVKNGIIKGDKKSHVYVEENDQWGFGISIKDAFNVEIINMQIFDTIGDGIYISSINKNSVNIKILNCNIYETMRQGITVTSGENIEIYNNEIHDIGGKNPQSAIDLESNNNDQKIVNVNIYNNKLYNLGGQYAIKIQKNIYSAKVYNNEIEQSIIVYDAKDSVSIINNSLKNGSINVYSNNNFQSNGFYLNKVIINENYIENGSIELTRVIDSCIEKNTLNNSYVKINASSCALASNTFYSNILLSYAYQIDYISYYKEVSEVYLYNNSVEGFYESIEELHESYLVKIYKDDYSKYIEYKTEKNF